MSLFKAKKWWSDDIIKSYETNEGVQNGSCMKVEKFSSHSESDCIIVGDEVLLKIYKPVKDENASDILLESDLGAVILQIETGKFIAGLEDRQILVLHPQSYSIYQVYRQEGLTDAGEQNQLKPVTKHSFTRKAHSLTCGPFGNIKTRDIICIQALDGSLSFFDQETFLFIYVFNDVIIPGPMAYVPSSDVFVICKSTWVLEIYSYQQLREFGELTTRQNKRNIPQWIYNTGEEISSLQVIQTSSNFASIIALGERHLCCFQDNGLMKYMVKFEFMAICFYAYIIGWYYEPTSRLVVMVASEDSKLYIYEGTTLLWSCDLLQTPISLSRCFLKYLRGGVVTLSTKGIVTVSYLGTEPDLDTNVVPMINDTTDPERIQEELEAAEDNLKKILQGDEDAQTQYTNIDQLVKIQADASKPVQNLFEQFGQETDESLHLLMCPIVVILSCTEPSLIQGVQITYNCTSPFACSEPTVCLENVNGTEIIETHVFLSSDTNISDATVKILFTITDSNGKISVLKRDVLLPLNLYCLPAELVIENEFKLILETNQQCVDMTEIFTDYTSEELLVKGNTKDKVSFAYRSTKRTVTVQSADKQYSIEANDASEITAVLKHVVLKLTEHYARLNVKDFSLTFNLDDEHKKTMVHKFLKCVEAHAKERIKLKTLENELSTLQRQFTLVQKKLLVQYGSLPPGDTDPLDFLMKDTHSRLIKSAHNIIQTRENTCRAGNSLAAVGQLLIFIFKRTVRDQFTVTLIQEMLALNLFYENHQEWEEAVLQGISHILNKVFQKSEKDKEKLAPVTEQGILSNINLKRFIKQIRLVLDKMFSETENDDNKGNRVTRIEEFVEVI